MGSGARDAGLGLENGLLNVIQVHVISLKKYKGVRRYKMHKLICAPLCPCQSTLAKRLTKFYLVSWLDHKLKLLGRLKNQHHRASHIEPAKFVTFV